MQISDAAFNRLYTYIKSNYGINLQQKRTLVEGRLSGMLEKRGFKSFDEFLDMVFSDNSGTEMTTILTKLTTNYTYFMREDKHFSFMRTQILPEVVSNSREKDLRIWSAGCSSGEEPYTIAMVIDDFFRGNKNGWDTRVLATDISQKVLSEAQTAVYPAERLEYVTPEWKRKYFVPAGNDMFSVSDNIKKEVIFRTFNLMNTSLPFRKKFHLIFCRNVMIYFDDVQRNALVGRYYDALERGGYLFVGMSESLSRTTTNFKYVMPSIYRKL